MVSIPSRGSGKGDEHNLVTSSVAAKEFQSPLGEVVKETPVAFTIIGEGDKELFQSPLGEVVKETRFG